MLIYFNGDTTDRAIYCWASNLDELIETAKVKLRLNKPVKFIYSNDGSIVRSVFKLNLIMILIVNICILAI